MDSQKKKKKKKKERKERSESSCHEIENHWNFWMVVKISCMDNFLLLNLGGHLWAVLAFMDHVNMWACEQVIIFYFWERTCE